ncbi:MAG TPA: flavin reductase family protein [Opitutaceae bacterium]|jgi:flavin reductase (DIM6/NTAB) family NADH-FMN oxidoreductase RutF|nr:flavin reductase family protein [Opitutaceae bacterium]
MLIDFSTLPVPEAYGWMISTITPRPIAWVSTISAGGKTNLAPFSFFQGVTASPPTLMFVPVNKRDGSKKDTMLNIEQVPEFVVNIVSYALAEKMNATSALLPHGESEFEKFGIASTPSERVRPPRVAAAPVAFECTLHSVVHIGEGPLAANVIFGRIQFAHVDDAVIGPDGKPDPARLDTIGRLGGELYSRTTERFGLKRPDR